MADYRKFEPSVKALKKETERDLYYIYRGNKILLVRESRNDYRIPSLKDIAKLESNLLNKQCMGSYGDLNCFSAEILKDFEEDNLSFISLIDYADKVGEEEYLLASKGKLLLDWNVRNQYCGKCGSRMEPKDSVYERSMICHNCSSATWPRTSPAILVSVVRDGKILLANNKTYPEGLYSVLAGFVEYGETLENAVKREVYEEVGIRLKNIEYFGSKPWPFPNSMMIAYTAEYESGELDIDRSELRHAAWFSKEELPKLYDNKNSIAGELIEDYKNKY